MMIGALDLFGEAFLGEAKGKFSFESPKGSGDDSKELFMKAIIGQWLQRK